MQVIFRGGTTALVGMASFYFLNFIGGALLSVALPSGVAWPLGTVLAAVCGVLAARFVWHGLGANGFTAGSVVARSALLGALVVGGIGFVGGFIGPMILRPEANQGPILGIFITGPIGGLLGALGGALYAFVRKKQGSQEGVEQD